jgi:hypothetical protein
MPTPQVIHDKELMQLVAMLAQRNVLLSLPDQEPGQPDVDEVMILDPDSHVPIWWPGTDDQFVLALRLRLPATIGDLNLRGKLLALLSTLRHMRVGVDEREPGILS